MPKLSLTAEELRVLSVIMDGVTTEPLENGWDKEDIKPIRSLDRKIREARSENA